MVHDKFGRASADAIFPISGSSRWVLALALFAYCVSAGADTGYSKAVVDVPDVENAIAVAKELDARKDQLLPKDKQWFEIRRGVFPVIVTAPHATQPTREGKVRFADGGGTAGLAIALHEICGVTVIYTTYDSPSDPNYYDDNDFKTALGNLIGQVKPAFLLDIHASSPLRPYEVDLGTMGGDSLRGDNLLVPALMDALKNEGIASVSVDWFSAARNQTITKYASSRGIPSVQLEFSSTRMTPADGDLAAHRFSQTIQALVEFLGKRNQCARLNNKPKT